MNYYFDSNTCIFYLKNSFPYLTGKIQQTPSSLIKIPCFVQAELLFGAQKSARRAKTLASVESFFQPYEIIPFGSEEALLYSEIRFHLEATGKPIGTLDILIAAVVKRHNGILVTNNTREFSRVPGLRVEDWTI